MQCKDPWNKILNKKQNYLKSKESKHKRQLVVPWLLHQSLQQQIVLTKQWKTDQKFCLLLLLPVKIWTLKHLAMFFGRAFVTHMDVGLNKHKNWSKAHKLPKWQTGKFNRNAFRLHSCRLSLIHAPVCADGATSQSKAYLLHLHIGIYF